MKPERLYVIILDGIYICKLDTFFSITYVAATLDNTVVIVQNYGRVNLGKLYYQCIDEENLGECTYL